MSQTSVLIKFGADGKINFLGFTPSYGPTAIGVVVFFIIAITQTILYFRRKAKYMIAMFVGAYFYAVGLALRFALRSNPDSLGMYAISNLFITLSPAAFIATEYALLSQITRRLHMEEFLLLPATKITKIFIWSDVITFLIQASGGGLQASRDHNMSKIGSDLFLAGLIAQLVSFVFFTIVYVRFLFLVRKRSPATWTVYGYKGWMEDWRTLAYVLGVSCGLVIIRTIFRVIEYADGYQGSLANTEWIYFVFDAIPLAIAIGLYIPFWPERFLPTLGTPFDPVALGSVQSAELGRSTVEIRQKL